MRSESASRRLLQIYISRRLFLRQAENSHEYRKKYLSLLSSIWDIHVCTYEFYVQYQKRNEPPWSPGTTFLESNFMDLREALEWEGKTIVQDESVDEQVIDSVLVSLC